MKNISFFIVISINVNTKIFYNYRKNKILNFNNISIEQKLQTVMPKEYVQLFSKYLWKIYQMKQNKLLV